MSILNQRPPAATPFPGIAHVTLAGTDDGLKSLSVWRQSMDPGQCTPPHSHSCEEVVLCEAGWGEIQVGADVHRFAAGQMAVLPPGVVHQIFARGEQPLVTLAVLSAAPVPVSLPDGTAVQLPWRS